jgi:hypothetical protein
MKNTVITEEVRNNYKPTWLYIKQHNITGLKYFGKTISKDPYSYRGSGNRWINHLKIHGDDISTLWCELFTDVDVLVEFATQFSIENKIVESDMWANLIDENGLDGGGSPSIETRKKIGTANKGRKLPARTDTHKVIRLKNLTGSCISEETRIKMSIAQKGRYVSDDTKQKIRDFNLGKTKSQEIIEKIKATKKLKTTQYKLGTCPHCNKTGSMNNMPRYHFDNCKNKK